MANYLGGFSPLKYKNGTPWNGAVQRYVAAGNIFVGDFVKLDGTAAVAAARPGTSAVPLKGVVAATNGASEAVLGVVVGFAPNPLNLNTAVGATAPIASGTQVFVVDDPNVLFQAKISGAAAFDPVNLGLNTVINTGTAGANGRSGQLVDAAVANGAAAPLKVLEFVDAVDNDVAAAGAQVIVAVNNHQLAAGTGRAGV